MSTRGKRDDGPPASVDVHTITAPVWKIIRWTAIACTAVGGSAGAFYKVSSKQDEHTVILGDIRQQLGSKASKEDVADAIMRYCLQAQIFNSAIGLRCHLSGIEPLPRPPPTRRPAPPVKTEAAGGSWFFK